MSQLPSKERNAELRERARGLQHKSDYGWRELVECLDTIEELSIAVDFADAATELVRKERDELLKDKSRIDWFDANNGILAILTEKNQSCGWRTQHYLEGETFRAAIDAAMTGGEK